MDHLLLICSGKQKNCPSRPKGSQAEQKTQNKMIDDGDDDNKLLGGVLFTMPYNWPNVDAMSGYSG